MKRFLLDLLVLAISGLALCLAHPTSLPIISAHYGYILNTGAQEALAWFGLVPFLFLAVRRELCGWKLYGYSFILMMFYFGPSIFWVNNAMVVYGGVWTPVSILVGLALAAIIGSQLALGLHSGLVFERRFKLPLWLTLPVCWTALEFARNYFLTGFPWSNLAYSQYLNIYFSQSAAIWGIYGINFVLILSNVVIFELIRYFRKEAAFPRRALAVFLLLLTFSYSYGIYRISANEQLEQDSPKLTTAMVQGNIDQDIKNFSYKHMYNIMRIYNDMTRAIPQEVDLVIWPEATPPYNLDRSMRNLDKILAPLGEHMPDYLLTGASTYSYSGHGRVFYNSAYMVDKKYNVTEIFDKSHLVPFGEYVPMKFLFQDILHINSVVPTLGRFEGGILADGMHFDGHNLGVLICYEGLFPEISRHYAREEVEFLVNLTNDAWFGPSAMPFQHLAQYVFRCIETRKALLRSTNTGISAIYNTSGRIVKQTGLFKREVLFGTIPLVKDRTIYSYIGDAPAFICLLLWGYGAHRLRRERKKNKTTGASKA